MENKAILLIFVSPPASGKTYFSTRFVKKNDFIRIGSDTVRETMFTHPSYSNDERKLVYEEIDRMVKVNLQHGSNVILDGNFLTNRERWGLLNRFKHYGNILFLRIAVDLEVTLDRAIKLGNPLNPRHEEHIRHMYQVFEALDANLPSITIKSGPYVYMERQLSRTLAKLRS